MPSGRCKERITRRSAAGPTRLAARRRGLRPEPPQLGQKGQRRGVSREDFLTLHDFRATCGPHPLQLFDAGVAVGPCGQAQPAWASRHWRKVPWARVA